MKVGSEFIWLHKRPRCLTLDLGSFHSFTSSTRSSFEMALGNLPWDLLVWNMLQIFHMCNSLLGLCCGAKKSLIQCDMHCQHGTHLLASGCVFFMPLSSFSRVQLFVIKWIKALQAPLSMRFSRQEYWSGLPCPPPGDHPDPGIEPRSLMSPAETLYLCTVMSLDY